MGFFDRFFSKEKESELNKGLEKTKTGFLDKITKAVAGKSTIDEEILDDLEQILVTSDVGLDTTIKIIDRIEMKSPYSSQKIIQKIWKIMIVALRYLMLY